MATTALILTNGELLAKAREQAGLDQLELAQLLGVSRTTISRWETNKGDPSVRQAKAIEEITGAAWLWLELRRQLSPLDVPVCVGVAR